MYHYVPSCFNFVDILIKIFNKIGKIFGVKLEIETKFAFYPFPDSDPLFLKQLLNSF